MVGLTAATIVAMVLYKNYITEDYIEVLNEGTIGSFGPALSTASAVAFGSLLVYADGFTVVVDLIRALTSNPLIIMIIIAAILGGVTGSSTGAVAVVMNAMSEQLLATGIAPAVLHRVSAVAAGVIVLVPHSGSYLTFRNLSGLSIGDTYKDAVIVVTGGHTVGLITMLILSRLLY